MECKCIKIFCVTLGLEMSLLALLTLPSKAPLSLLEVAQLRVTFIRLLTPVAVWRVKEGGRRRVVPHPPPCSVRGPEGLKEEQLMAERSEGVIPTGLRTQQGPAGDSSKGRTWQPHTGGSCFPGVAAHLWVAGQNWGKPV